MVTFPQESVSIQQDGVNQTLLFPNELVYKIKHFLYSLLLQIIHTLHLQSLVIK